MLEFDVRAETRAPPEEVWALLTDADRWPEWVPFDEVVHESGQQVGALRRVRSGRVTTRERVVAWEPPRRYAYEIVSGLPIRDYTAEILMSPGAGRGTRIRWRGSFRAIVPGTGRVLRLLLGRAVSRAAHALAERADELT